MLRGVVADTFCWAVLRTLVRSVVCRYILLGCIAYSGAGCGVPIEGKTKCSSLKVNSVRTKRALCNVVASF